MGNGAMALGNQYQLSNAERVKYQQPYLDLVKQGRHKTSIRRVLLESLLKDRANAMNMKRPVSSGGIRPSSKQLPKKNIVRKDKDRGPNSWIGSNIIEVPKQDHQFCPERKADRKYTISSVAITDKPYHHDRVNKHAKWKAAIHHDLFLKWYRLLKRLNFQIEYNKTLQSLHPYGNYLRRVPLNKFSTVFTKRVHIGTACRWIHVSIVLHDNYEERKFIPGLSPIFEVVASYADSGEEVQPRLYLSVNLLRSLLADDILHEVHVKMTVMISRRVTAADAAKAIADAAHASTIRVVKSATVEAASSPAADPSTITTGTSEYHLAQDVVPLERSRFTVWLDRTRRGRLSISKTASASVELLRGIRRGSRSYSVIMADINSKFDNEPHYACANDNYANRTMNARRRSSASAMNFLDIINSIAYETMAKHIFANISLTPTKRGYSGTQSPSLANHVLTLVISVVHQNGEYQSDGLIPSSAYRLSASSSQKEVLFIADHIVRRFISPARIIPCIHRCSLSTSVSVEQGFKGAMESFATAARKSKEASSVAASLAKVAINPSPTLANPFENGVKIHALATNPNIRFGEVSAVLDNMLRRRLEEMAGGSGHNSFSSTNSDD